MDNQNQTEHQADASGHESTHDNAVDRPEASAADVDQSLRQMSRSVKRGIFLLLFLVAIAGGLQMKFDIINKLAVRFLGPPRVQLQEAYSDTESSRPFDHSVLDGLLQAHVDADGWVDYAAINASSQDLESYLDAVADADMETLGRDDRLAFLINAYNAFTLKLIIEHYPLNSIKNIPANERWDAVRWHLAGQTVSLSQIEHELIRPNFVEPRIHFALVCAAVGCPPLRNKAYAGEQLDDQLDQRTVYVHQHVTWLQFDDREELRLTQLYNWYGGDFEQAAGSVVKFVAKYVPALKEALASGNTPTISWLSYDWRLNDNVNRQRR